MAMTFLDMLASVKPVARAAAPVAAPASLSNIPKAPAAIPATAATLGSVDLPDSSASIKKTRHERDLSIKPPKLESKIIPLSKIDPDDSWNCRGKINEKSESFLELTESLRSGLQQPLKVTPIQATDRYKLVSGYRRYKGLTKIGCPQAMCIVAYYDDPIAAVLDNLLENMHRERLRPFEVARALSGIYQRGYTLRSIAKHVGLSMQHVGNLVRCHEKLIPPLKEVFRTHQSETTLTELIAIACLPAEEQLTKHSEIVARANGGTKPPELQRPVKLSTDEKEESAKKAKMRSRTEIEDFILDLYRAHSIKKSGKGHVAMDDEVRDAICSAMRWALGEQRNPLQLASENAA